MRTLSCALLISLLAGLAALEAQAKRAAPKEVAPLTRQGIIYAAPHEHLGCVVAKDEKTGRLLWRKQIYLVKYDPALEQDVQDCFITELRFADDKLLISNERGGQFELNLSTLAVKVLKGAEVIDRTSGN